MSDRPILPGPGPIEPVPLKVALEERYLAYALKTIMDRALPDVRDGLKPVHRRIIYAMQALGLTPTSAYMKSARVVGDTMGKLHPHGDMSIYDAMVRLAQDFSSRYPLVDGQGNFGNIDGDNPAAYRYTEARLTTVAEALLEGIDENAVDFRLNYDEKENEPTVLPSAFPNLLANGASGIAVGMATNIPPHNVDEICQALLHLIKHPNAGIEKLLDFIQGPDFPTGGILVEPRASMIETYTTGRGSFRLRARWEKEDTGRGGYQIIVTQIPFQVQKSRLVEKIAELLQEKKLPLLGDMRDESAEHVRLVLEPRTRTVDPIVLMESLFRLTELETRFNLNMNVLTAGQIPAVLGLRDVMGHWLEHRQDVLIRRTEHRLEKIAHRLEVLAGYLIAFLNIEEVIRIVRFEDEPKARLMAKFKLSDVQAEAILNLRLRSLSRIEEQDIRAEHAKLTAEQHDLKDLVGSDDRRWETIAGEIKEIRERWSKKTVIGRRRTDVAEAPTVDVDLDAAMIEKEPVTILLSEKGWVRALKGHQDDLGKVEFKQGDGFKRAIKAQTTDKILVFATNGKFYTLEANQLPGGRGHGEPLRILVDIEETADFVEMFVYEPGRRLLVAASSGHGFVVPEDDVIASTRKGKQVLNVEAPAEACVCVPAAGNLVATVGSNRKMLVFGLDEVNEMGRGKGVYLQRFREGVLSDVRVFAKADGLTWSDAAGRTHTRTWAELKEWVGERAQAGTKAPQGFPLSNRFGPAF